MPRLLDLMRAAGQNPRETLLTEEDQRQLARYLEMTPPPPVELLVDLVRQRVRVHELQATCATATEAASKLEAMLGDLLSGNALLCPLTTLRLTPSGPRAVCRVNGTLREFAIHPAVDVEQLRQLHPYDYVVVHEQVVVDLWTGDPWLYTHAHGPVVEFKGYQDRARHLVRIADGPQERVAVLDPSLRETPLRPSMRLIVHRDDPFQVVARVPWEQTESRFEIPVDRLRTRLEDLAGVEDIAQQLLEDVLVRICCPDVRDQFGLEPLKGVLLYSYKPGMGKTAFMRAIALWLHEHGAQLGFEVVLYAVKPNETKSMWHGEDARIVREDLWGAIRARQALPRTHALVQIVVLDEVDALGKRAGRGEVVSSSAQSEALEAMLVEMDGLEQDPPRDTAPAYVLCVGLTNRPDRVDEAAKRPGRFSLVLPMPDVTPQSAEDILAIYARGDELPWYLHGEVCTHVPVETVRRSFLRPALGRLFHAVVLRYTTDTQQGHEVTAGQLLSNAHYMDVMNRAKKRAALRHLRNSHVPAVTADDVADCLLEVACEAARQIVADPQMLIRQLDLKVPVARVDAVPAEELDEHRYLRVAAS
ncbi:MAG: AAA family ATPase [Pirellulaceae bacterium]|jgi:ATP-dependent 26S proteasome regulatory subunit|nr:AAA family ATPase [Pirellulaceae bacterium]